MGRRLSVRGWPVRLGGHPHRGWLPPGAAQPLPTPTRSVLLDIAIEAGESGCLLIVEAQDGSMASDTWHASPDEAMRAASTWFGVGRDDWMTD
ncbi:hypothetical protein AB1L88_14970 [Tautonia sp. JC769]|uniref:hypothetical protein n=1 Tax=Tautonia sp. JC769 TaxID=3232135 RepID=UPI00345B1CDC